MCRFRIFHITDYLFTMFDVQELLKLPKQPAKTVRFFKRGGMYYCIEQDAELVSSKYIKSFGSLKDSSNGGGKYVNFSEALYISLLRDLLINNHTSIEIYEFESGNWNKTIEASPGNVSPVLDLINNDLFLSSPASLLAVHFQESQEKLICDAATCDSSLYTISTTEYIEAPSFCHFESLITQTMPNELVLICLPDRFINRVYTIVDKFGIPYRTINTIKSVEIGDLPQFNSLKTLVSNLKLNLSEFKHQHFKLIDFMTIDYSASMALNIFPDDKLYKGLPTSLYQLLNMCVTPMGSRLLQQNMQQPLLDVFHIEERLDKVEAFFLNPEPRMRVREIMKQLPDSARLVRKFISKKASLQDCVRLYDIANVVDKLSFLGETGIPQFSEFIESIRKYQKVCNDVKELVEKSIDFSMIPQHIYRICPSFSEDLQVLSDEINSIKSQMEKKKNKIADSIGIDRDKIKLERSTNQKSFYMRIPRSMERDIRGDNTLNVIETRKDGVHITTTEITEFSNQILDKEAEYTNQQKSIQSKVIDGLLKYDYIFLELGNVIADIDFHAALAEVSTTSNYVRPKFASSDDPELILNNARHPLLEKHTEFIPSNIEMKKGDSSFFIISGPNSAGKSTLLKTVGCCAFLAHIGCFVPCDSAKIPIIPSIHARVGAWDSLHMSTFTVEMTEMASILESASSSSLVIVDELGRSTSCSDGFGLAWAISKHLATNIGAFTLFATHFHELCKLSDEIPCVKNFHMDAEVDDRLIMKYQLVPGPFPHSFGIEAADRAGFPQSVMKNARAKVRELEIADGEVEVSSTTKKQSFDPNYPYLKFLRSIAQKEISLMNPKEYIEFIESGLSAFEEDKRTNTFADSE